MIKKDILGLIKLDIERKKKPKKSLDDILIGEEDKNDVIMKKKNLEEKPKKKNPLDEMVGVSQSQEKAAKPGIKLIDWGELSKMSPREQMKTLRREYLMMVEKLEEVTADYLSEQQGKAQKAIELEKFKKEVKVQREFLRDIVELIPDAFELKMQMDTTPWEVSDIRGDMIDKVKSLVSKVKFSEKIIEDETKQINAHKKLLEDELYRARERIKELESNPGVVTEPFENTEVFEQTHTSAPVVAERPVETVRNPEPVQKTVNPFQSTSGRSETVKKPETKKNPFVPNIPEDVPKYVFIEVDHYVENLTEQSKFVLNVVGRTGVARNSELKQYIEESEEGKKLFYTNGKYNNGEINAAVKLLKDRQIFNGFPVKLGSKGGYDFQGYKLSDIGKSVYFKFNSEHPVESEIEQILRDHKSLEHGYLIKDSAAEFRAMGYTVYEDRETCTYKLKDGKRKVFDFIIEQDGKKQHIEVERGTHNDDDFLNAMDKIYEVTNEFYFIAPNQNILYQVTKGKVFKWITEKLGGFENAKGKITMHFATFENVKKRPKNIWEIFKP